MLCIPPSSIFATLNFVFVVTQLLRISEDISKFWFVHHRQNMNAPLFFFLLYFFLFLFFFYICSILLHVKFEDADNQKLTLRQQTQDFGLYNTINRHFFTIYRTGENISVHSRKRIGTFIFFYLPEKTFLRFPVKIHQKLNLRIRAN